MISFIDNGILENCKDVRMTFFRFYKKLPQEIFRNYCLDSKMKWISIFNEARISFLIFKKVYVSNIILLLYGM